MLRLTRLFSTTSVALKIGYRKPPSAYHLFVQEWYPKVQESNQSATAQEVSKQVAAKWNEAPASLKNEFQAIYEQKLEAFKNKDPEFAYHIKPEPPFEKFSNKNYEKVAKKLKTKDKKVITEELTKLWDEVSEEEKSKLTAKYEKALSSYKKKTSKKAHLTRPANAYLLFSLERRASPEYADKDYKEKVKTAAQEWKTLSENEKAKYYDQYAALKEKHDAEVAAAKGPSPPPSKYNLFVKERYAETLEANPGLPAKDIFKKIAEQWQIEKENF